MAYITRTRRRGLGDGTSTVWLQSTPDELNQALQAAQQNGIDPSVIQNLYNSGADFVQLMLAATNAPLGASTIQSELDTVNQDVGASNYQLTGSASAGGFPDWVWALGGAAAAIVLAGLFK